MGARELNTVLSQDGRAWIALSPYRKNITTLMRLSRHVPLVTADRRMHLAPLVEARQACAARPSWSAIFAKAFAMVSAHRPELRRAYMSYPWPHLHQSSRTVATIVIERTIAGEDVPLFFHILKPEQATLRELHETLQRAQTMPIEEFPRFRRMRWIGRMPGPIRSALWRMAYHFSGRTRARYFGTFALSSPAPSGAGLVTIITPLTCTLHYGLLDENGGMDMRLTFDHRAIDGAPVARALADVEETLLTEIVTEVRRIGRSQHAA
jgi:hypothetical protein